MMAKPIRALELHYSIIQFLIKSSIARHRVKALGSLSNYDDDHNDDFKNNNRLNDQNNSSARASCFLVHFFDVHCTTTT